ncbi:MULTISPECIES: type VI secretion system baseplate subunit TssK [unclassified Pseudomonas]|uniref:type VI secretion system baseplate subunit TssK n=1 Tax=unclassified Pseudomonas TaxID=196821 RepID=UPI00119B9F20|nr:MULTISPECIES: type VI secretion system baseplate subunit TssK [unclassified Pseudomonas]TWC15045.1 type VI secretion system protein ImpJ [Pseudomonas sp. SJZ074]TWC19831.1 type VI secretion system protein ImpJ [Pseudomonas sp. SJZ075]TWC33476.1 type VI secretion system protein ImpJ [Pseudomonas sp. SJZ085]TWC35269.1 type VI secretion system protein ImpJ [Pseudomonas sp. SJZ078]TWC56215.1 type VI secretion system protein ImpJ [Pseudomonas sp. SJZ124]
MSLLPDAVCWHEGMQLLPQHFQLQGLRAEALAAHVAAACNPWFWGVGQLEVDPSALSAGQVRLLQLQGTLPDGLPVNLQAGVGPTLELDITEAVNKTDDATVTVYLAISPLWRAGQLLPLKGRLQSVVGDALPDLTSGEFPESITVWRPNPRLCTQLSKADSICLPLLRIRKEGGGFLRLPYTPPTPVLLPESALGRRVAGLCARAREKCLFLAGRLRQAQAAGNQDDALEIRRQMTALWARLPEVEGSLNTRVATPQALYGLLLGLAGAWSALDPLAGVPAFAPLDFLELQRGYEPLLDWLDATLELVRAGYRSLAFERNEQVFSIQLPDDQPSQRLVIGLRMPNGASEQAAADWLRGAIIASAPHVPLLSRQRMSGLPHQAMSRNEQVAYSVGDDTRLFVVAASGQWFDGQLPLHIVAPASTQASSPWQVVLFVPQVVESA